MRYILAELGKYDVNNIMFCIVYYVALFELIQYFNDHLAILALCITCICI